MASQSQPSTKYTWISCIRRENGSPEPRETQAETSEPKRVVVGARGALESHAKMSENNLASIPLNWKNLLVKTHDHMGVRKHLQNTTEKRSGYNFAHFCLTTTSGSAAGTWRWLRGRSPRKCHEVAWKLVNEVDQIQRHETPLFSHI